MLSQEDAEYVCHRIVNNDQERREKDPNQAVFFDSFDPERRLTNQEELKCMVNVKELRIRGCQSAVLQHNYAQMAHVPTKNGNMRPFRDNFDTHLLPRYSIPLQVG